MNLAEYYPFSDFSSSLQAPNPIRPRESVFGKIFGMSNQPLRKIVADNVRRLQKRHPELERQADLARAAEVSQSSINRLLEGETNCLLITAVGVANAFGVSLYELIEEGGTAGGREIPYNRKRYAELSAAEKERIAAFIEFTIANRDRQMEPPAQPPMRSKDVLRHNTDHGSKARSASDNRLTTDALRANENLQHKPRKRGTQG